MRSRQLTGSPHGLTTRAEADENGAVLVHEFDAADL